MHRVQFTCTCRFPKSAALERLYDFVDSNGPGAEGPSSSCQAGTYLLVSPRPRKVGGAPGTPDHIPRLYTTAHLHVANFYAANQLC